jgi:putative inorganic carbon (HCO3(-)) transporter
MAPQSDRGTRGATPAESDVPAPGTAVIPGRRSPRWHRWLALEGGVLFCAAPLLLFPHRFGTAYAVAACLAILAVRGLAFKRAGPRARTPVDVPLAILLLMALVGTAVSVDRTLSQPKLFGLIFGAAALVSTRHVLSYFGTLGVHIGATFLAVQGVLIATLALVGVQWTVGRIPGLTAVYARLPRLIGDVQGSTTTSSGLHPAEVGGILLLLWPCLVSPFLWPTRGWPARALFGAGAVLTSAVLLLTASRSVYAGAATALFVLLALRAPRIALGLGALAGIGVVATLVLAGPDVVGAALGSSDVADLAQGSVVSFRGRQELWSRAVMMIQDFPFTGIGLNTFPFVLERLYPTFLIGPDEHMPHAHSLFLQTGVDLGLPGLLAFIWILGIVWRCWTRAWRRRPETSSRPPAGPRHLGRVRSLVSYKAALAGVGAGIAGHLVFGLTDAVTLGAKPGYLLWMAFGVAISAGLSTLPVGAKACSSSSATRVAARPSP